MVKSAAIPIPGRAISRGIGEGEVLVSRDSISFLGGVDAKTGIVVEKGHALEGKCIAGKVLVFPHGKGSTVGSYVLYQLARNGKAPAAMVNEETEVIIAVGAIISKIPLLDKLDVNGYATLKDGMSVRVDAEKGRIVVLD